MQLNFYFSITFTIENTMINALLVDDDQISNLLNRKVLERTGQFGEISTALNGKEALGILQRITLDGKSIPHIILLDLNMPIMDGFTFLEEFEKLKIAHKENIKVVILSSSNNPEDIKKAKRMGVHDYLTKPVSEQSLNVILHS